MKTPETNPRMTNPEDSGIKAPALDTRTATSAADVEELPVLLEAFQVDTLGYGNSVVGTNQLAAMAIMLANLSRPGSGIVTPEGRRLEVGCDILAEGPLVTGGILDEVVRPMRRRQDILLSQLERLQKDDEEEERRAPNRRWALNHSPRPSEGETAFFSLMTGDSDHIPLLGSRGDQWIDAVEEPPSGRPDELYQRPRIIIAASSPSILAQQLPAAHLGQPLVVIGLNQAAEAKKFGDLCSSLIDGLLPVRPSGGTLSSRMLVTDIGGVIRDIAKSADEKSVWLGRLLWLVEDGSGPGLPPLPTVDSDVIRLPNPAGRFERAVSRAFADRLNDQQPGPTLYQWDLMASQGRWMTFLTGMERSLPGITATARGLFTSLVFGLRRLTTADKIPQGFRYTNEGVEALARWLVRRMANYRAALFFSAEEARRVKDKRRILNKLSGDSLDTRSLYHPLHIDADYCRELLAELETDHYVRQSGGIWERIGGRTLPTSPVERLALEV